MKRLKIKYKLLELLRVGRVRWNNNIKKTNRLLIWWTWQIIQIYITQHKKFTINKPLPAFSFKVAKAEKTEEKGKTHKHQTIQLIHIWEWTNLSSRLMHTVWIKIWVID